MRHRVRTNLILFDDFLHQLRVGLCHPTNDEESSLSIRILQDSKHPFYILMYPNLILPPVGFGARSIEVQQVKLFFYVECQYIHRIFL